MRLTALSLNPVALALAATLSLLPTGADAATLRGRLVDDQQKPIAQARVRVPALDRALITDADGRFVLADAPAGELRLDIETGGYGRVTRTVTVGESELVLVIDNTDAEHLVITANPLAHRALDMAAPAQVLAGDRLLAARAATIGETLDNLPGVSNSSFGPGAGRPVIRGQSGARVQVLQNGLGTLDASTVSADHNISAESLSTEQIEVLRGPATLLYGSGAIGGVVNIVDHRIPEQPVDGLEGSVELRTQSANDEKAGAIALDFGRGSFAAHLDAWSRRTGNLDIPGYAERPDLHDDEHEHEDEHDDEHDDHDEPGVHGVLPNSALDSNGFSLGASAVGARGYLGIAISDLNSLYGVPGHSHGDEHAHEHEHEHEDEHDDEHDDEHEAHAGVRIDLEQKRSELKGALDHPFAGIEQVKLRIASASYRHTELEGVEIGTVFRNDASESRLEIVHHPLAGFRGVIGTQISKRDFSAVGEEAFTPPSVTESEALFIVEERDFGAFHLEAGLRLESQSVRARSVDGYFSDDTRSVSLGGIYELNDRWSTALSLAQAERMPTAEELFSDGAHLATQSYEQGNADLRSERANNIDWSLRYQHEGASLNLSLYRNRVDHYIYSAPTGETIDELPVYAYAQADAELDGIELSARLPLFSALGGDWYLRGLYDRTNGELRAGGNLPRLAPERVGIGADFEREDWLVNLDWVEVADQDKLAAYETATDGYSLLALAVQYRLLAGDSDIRFFVRGSNLLDEEIRLHTSYLKDLAPQAGRSFTAGVRVSF